MLLFPVEFFPVVLLVCPLYSVTAITESGFMTIITGLPFLSLALTKNDCGMILTLAAIALAAFVSCQKEQTEAEKNAEFSIPRSVSER